MEQYKGLPLFTFTIDPDLLTDGVDVVSLVHKPACGKTFIALAEEPEKQVFDDDKMEVTGVVLRPDYPIFRDQEIMGVKRKFYFTVTAAQVELIMEKFMREQRTKSVDLNHRSPVSDVFLKENYLLSDRHTVSYPEFADVEPGTWMATYKVENPAVWREIRAGNLTGFSPHMVGDMTRVSLSMGEYNSDYEFLTLMFQDDEI